MMKWKNDRASSSHQSLITHVFPVSWLSKFKKKKRDSIPPTPLMPERRFSSRGDCPDHYCNSSFNGKTPRREEPKKDPEFKKLKRRDSSEERESSVHNVFHQECSQKKKKRRRRRKQRVKLGVHYSPRNECKIKSLEETKKGKMKNVERKGKNNKTGSFERFAMVKSSFDPEQDFKDSMAEMITKMGIKSPEDLEELLACYLTLNCDHHHHIIIKAFREVWFQLNQDYSG
ncbi:hypothetical protein DM860_002007 [Cuscuta australis]|uniref:Transcription repressor n=1 Tax=Cuscuta australis TaxID=267555 RepID=A0A328DWQ1_9ASTE|nr:hypothetical protein DM860_002007 [Cuscuta australis]